MSIANTRKEIDNLSSFDDLTRKVANLESQTIAWMAQATALHAAVDTEDKQLVLDLLDDLIAKLAAATAI